MRTVFTGAPALPGPTCWTGLGEKRQVLEVFRVRARGGESRPMGEERADEAKPKTNVTVTCRQGRGRTTVKRNTKPEGRPGRLLYGLLESGGGTLSGVSA